MSTQQIRNRLQVLQAHLTPADEVSINNNHHSAQAIQLNHTSAAAVSAVQSLSSPLEEERRQSILNPQSIRALTHILSEGEDVTLIKEYAMQLMERDVVFGQVDNYDKNLEELREISMKKARKGPMFFKNIALEMDKLLLNKDKNMDASERERMIGIANRHVWSLLSVSDPGSFTRFGVHCGLFMNAIKGQGHDELRNKVVPLAESLQIYGVFAMTELGHGSYLRGLETTATFDADRDEFVIHSPTDTSTKWWIGGAGSTATHAVVFAQLCIAGKSYGPHSFLVQLRDLRTHEPMMGVAFGDIGKKMGRDTIDNGWIQFTRVRIPRGHMLMKWAQVSREGKYTPPPLPQLAYGAVVPARIDIAGQSSVDLQRALTIAIRYGCVRRQFHTTSLDAEQKIMDYQSHQYRLFPYVSAAFAMHFSAAKLNNVHNRALHDQEKGIVSSILPDLHNLSAGLKAYTTWITYEGIESCRQACGGHGYSAYSGFPQMLADSAVQQTWDGQNSVLAQQTSRYLLKTIIAVTTGRTKSDISNTSVAYLTDLMTLLTENCEAKSPEDFSDVKVQLHALRFKSAKLLSNTGLRAQKIIGKDRKKNMPIAWNECQVDLLSCAKAHCYLYMAESFMEAVAENTSDASVHRVLKNICDLFVCHMCLEQDATILLSEDYMSSKQYKMLGQRVRELMKEIRRDSISIVDSFNLSDFIINSPLGCYDGQVYKKYFDRVKASNPTAVIPPYYSTLIKDMINPNVTI